MSLLESALHLASLGFYVFPLAPNGKTPVFKDYSGRATRDPEKIKEWWRDRPFNIGVITSRFGDGRAVVAVDVDNKGEKNGDEALLLLEMEGLELPPTFTQVTPTGGKHLVYISDAPVKQGVDVLAPGLDIRSKGGYLVGAGSQIDGKQYTISVSSVGVPAPKWLIDKCGTPLTRESFDLLVPSEIVEDRARQRAVHYLEKEAPLSVEGAGGDHTAFKVAAHVKDLGVDRLGCFELMSEHWNDRCSPPWSGEELALKVEHAYRYGVKPVGVSAPETQFFPVKDAPGESKRKFKFKRYSEIKPNFRRRALVQGLLNPGDVSLVFAESNSGKSWFAIDVAHAVATGTEFLGKKVQRFSVLYVVAEGVEGFKKRVAAYQKSKNLNPLSVPLFMVDEHVDLLNRNTQDTSAIIDTVKTIEAESLPVGLIIVDTLSRVMGSGDENKSEDMNAFTARISRITKETGAHVMIVHHSGKDSSKGARGHSSLRAAVDTEIRVEKRKNVFVATVTKQRDQEFGQPIVFSLDKVVLGEDLDGVVVDSCVVIPASLDDHKEDMSDAAQKALSAFEKLAFSNDPFNPKPVSVSDWQKEFSLSLPDISRQARHAKFKQGRSELESKNKVRVEEDFVFVGEKK